MHPKDDELIPIGTEVTIIRGFKRTAPFSDEYHWIEIAPNQWTLELILKKPDAFMELYNKLSS